MRRADPIACFGAMVSALALAGCQQPASPFVSSSSSIAANAAPSTVPNLVQGVCGDCHGVEPPFLSPNPEAPGFDAIANREGLSDETLSTWLIDAHNYPEIMEFELDEAEARKVADYMLTLRDAQYRPAP